MTPSRRAGTQNRGSTVSTTADVPALAMSAILLLRWALAIGAFPIGGYVGHLIGGPAATVPASQSSPASSSGRSSRLEKPSHWRRMTQRSSQRRC